MNLARKLYLGIFGLFLLFFAYTAFFDVRPSSFDIGRIYSLPTGSVINSDSMMFYNGAGSFSTVMEGDDWRTERFLRMAVKVGENAYPGITFYMRGSIPPDAQLLVQWRAVGKPGRILIDVTDGVPGSGASKAGENFFAYADTPAEIWSSSTIPLAKFERNPVQPPGAPTDGRFDTNGIQAVSLTFFPLSDFILDVKEVAFVWKSRHAYSSSLIGFVMGLGLLLWLRMPGSGAPADSTRSFRTHAAVARVVSVLIAFAAALAVVDRETRLSGIAPLLVFGYLCGMVIVDEFGRKKWMRARAWSFRYFPAALAGWYLDFTHSPALLSLLLVITLVPVVVRGSRWLLFDALALAALALVVHPRATISTTLVPGALVIAALGVAAFLALEILQHRRAVNEANHIRSLYQDILENSSDGIFFLGPDRSIEAANHGFEAMLDRPGERLVGRNLRELVHAEDLPLLYSAGKSPAELKPRKYYRRFITGEGKICIGLVREVPVFTRGTLSGYHVVATDITERKQTEVEREKLLQELQSDRWEIKSQSGFLPICAVCKNIRDEAGNWHQIEMYMSGHFSIQFTHGICPICTEKLYPEVTRKSPSMRRSAGPTSGQKASGSKSESGS